MSSLIARLIVPGVLFVFTVGSGVWLWHAGRPLSALIVAMHKIAALVTVVLLGVVVHRLAGITSLRAVEWGAVAVAGVLAVALFASGAILSADRPASAVLLAIHKVAPVLAVICAAGMLYLLASGR